VIRRHAAKPQPAEVPPWILPPASCDLLRDLAALFPPALNSFEFGSGQSTHALRAISSQTTTVENSDEWLSQTEAQQPSRREQDQAAVVPLRRTWNRLRLIETFDLSGHALLLNSLGQSRLILVDSPPNPAKREAALYLALQAAPVGAVIVIDDLEVRAVGRFSERLARQNQGAFRFWRVPIDHQLGVFLKLRQGRVHSRPTLREFVGTWLRA
jgi:hypothetical protein